MTPAAATLKALRLRAKLTQAQLADKAGIDRSWLNQMERGKRPIGPKPAERLAAALGVTATELGIEERTDVEYQSLHDRLVELEAAFRVEQTRRERALRAVTRRLAGLEAALELQAQRSDPRRTDSAV